MSFKDFLYQWWRLKEVKRKEGTRERDDDIYHSHPYCTGFKLERWPNGSCLYFNYFLEKGKTIGEYWWRTSYIESIDESESIVIVTTRNTVYTFEKTDEDPLVKFKKEYH